MLVERWLTSSVEDRESALISRRYGVPGSFILLLYWNWYSCILEMGVSGNLWIVVKDVEPLVVYDVEFEMAMDSMKVKCASYWVDLEYTNLFCILEVTSVFFYCCDSVLGDSLHFHQGNRGSSHLWLEHWTPQHEMQGNQALSCSEGEVSWVFSSCGRHLVYILELQRGWPFEPRVCSATSGHLSSYDGHLGKLYYAWQENTDTSGSEPGGQAYLISWHIYSCDWMRGHI